ncbi:signal peptidase I [Natronorarus salvus]|uniref:signal peptidase I n=1 Tax=Natronorarus salvus TaxID=3117733 RepID=UPI002F2684F3
MSGTLVGRALSALLVLALLAMLVGAALGQPVGLAYVASGSMEPTLSTGDGFLAVPSAFVEVEEGDVVVFEARELHDGGLTTHRVVGETDAGYVTRGDANPFTDQDGPEPPVTDDRIVAVAPQVNGEVVSIPHLGTGVMALQTAVGGIGPLGRSAGSLLVWIGLLLTCVALLSNRGTTHRTTDRSRSRAGVIGTRTLVVVVVALVVIPVTAAMVVPSGVHTFGIASTTADSDDPLAIEPGETSTVEHTLHNDGVVPAVAVLEPASDGIAVESDRRSLPGGSSEPVSVTLSAPEEEGEYYRSFTEHRYLAVLPSVLLVWLHGIHPLVALSAVNLVALSIFLVLAAVVAGLRPQRIRSPSTPLSVRVRRTALAWWERL